MLRSHFFGLLEGPQQVAELGYVTFSNLANELVTPLLRIVLKTGYDKELVSR